MLDYGLHQKQIQKLAMTPKLRQSIAILQMPAQELAAYVAQQIVDNPALDPDTSEDEAEESYVEGSEDLSSEDTHDIGWQEYFDHSSDLGHVRDSRGGSVEQTVPCEQYVRWTPTLSDCLMSQFGEIAPDAISMRLGQYIIGSLDRDGYLRDDLREIADACGVDLKTASGVLRLIQDLDPPGIAARDLSECLSIQLRRLSLDDGLKGLCLRLVTNHLDDMAQMTQNQLARALKTDVGVCQQAVDVIKSLNPRPAATLDHVSDAAYVIPDAIVREIDGEFIVLVNDAAAPTVSVNPLYRRLVSEADSHPEAARFLKERLESAIWLAKSIDQRRTTVYRITECIVRRQRDFLISGTKALKPMTLRDVADELGIHESTVCRASSGKYVQTPRGTYELSFFFQSGVASAEGGGVSSAAVKRMISELIEVEDPERPLSDLSISKRLRRRGIMVSRRTVAKYRESAGIPSSMGRRRYVRQPQS
jgi:RNA polymerase sigma-54 factor